MPSVAEERRAAGQRSRVILLAVLLLLVGVSIAYNVWNERRYAVRPLTRKTSDFLVDWRCLACGHTLNERAGIGPRACPQCRRDELYVSIRFGCPRHGVVRVAFQYDENLAPSRIKVADRDWVPLMDLENDRLNAVCPTCGSMLAPAEAPRPAAAEPP